MDIDEPLRELWQRQQPPQADAHYLFERVRRQRRAVIVRRTVEVALTLMAVAVLGWPMWNGNLEPAHWLLIPFFSVFLIVIWTILLKQQLGRKPAVSESAAVFARQRKRQLLDSLKNLSLAERGALALFIYAAVAFAGGYLLGDSAWKFATSFLLAYSGCWYFATRWLVPRKRRALWREYRAVRRMG